MKKTLLTLMLSGLALYSQAQTLVNLTLAQAQPALLGASAGSSVTITDSESTTLLASASGGTAVYYYKWSPATGLSNATIASPKATPRDTTTYTVTVTDKNRCTATAEVTINVTKHNSSADYTAAEGLTIYPNPVGGSFYINLRTQTAIAQVSLYTLEGKELWNRSISTAGLPATAFDAPATPGMYLLKVTAGNRVLTETIVVTQNNK